MHADTITFLRKILTDDVEARATIEQIKNDSWLVPNTPPALSLRRKMIDKNNSEAQQMEYCTTEKRRRLEVLGMTD
ncbi:hypothetical protein CAEBREN_03664 [Caenorhabditis brenneri]|uniref:Uncharacterized protein n=1 Tax=Caenorhabditis brenneri TaxID=135651 RepID=G0NXZ6_CAEBE|nr:hypothetical protein CAEBREN_03664 [Caenorhabditis brenneri]